VPPLLSQNDAAQLSCRQKVAAARERPDFLELSPPAFGHDPGLSEPVRARPAADNLNDPLGADTAERIVRPGMTGVGKSVVAAGAALTAAHSPVASDAPGQQSSRGLGQVTEHVTPVFFAAHLLSRRSRRRQEPLARGSNPSLRNALENSSNSNIRLYLAYNPSMVITLVQRLLSATPGICT